ANLVKPGGREIVEDVPPQVNEGLLLLFLLEDPFEILPEERAVGELRVLKVESANVRDGLSLPDVPPKAVRFGHGLTSAPVLITVVVDREVLRFAVIIPLLQLKLPGLPVVRPGPVLRVRAPGETSLLQVIRLEPKLCVALDGFDGRKA